MITRSAALCFLIMSVMSCKFALSPSSSKDTSYEDAPKNISIPSESTPTDFDPQICYNAPTSNFLSPTRGPECSYYCDSCLGIGIADTNAVLKAFTSIVWAQWWAAAGLEWVMKLTDSLQKVVSERGQSAFSSVSCLPVVMIALVRINDTLSKFNSRDAKDFYGNSPGKAVCGVTYALSACSGATSFPPVALALKPYTPAINAAMATCSVGEFVADKIVCNATKKGCLAAIEQAKPTSQGNRCCCKTGSTWTLELEHPCMNQGGTYLAGSCGDGLPNSPAQCSVLESIFSRP